MLALLALIADRMIVVGRTESKIAYNLRSEAVAEAAADGAVFEAIYRLTVVPPRGWTLDGRAHRVVIGGETIAVGVEDENTKINLNAASQAVLEALLRQVGVTADQSRILAAEIVEWRAPNQDPAQAARIAIRRQLAGLPEVAPFHMLGELAGVPGMTADLVARLMPHLTLDDPGGKNPGRLDPIVAAALKEASAIASLSQAKTPISLQHVVTIRAQVLGDVGFERDAIVSVGGGQSYRIVSWAADRDQ